MTTEEWTVGTLKQHYDAILVEHATAHRAEHTAAEHAVEAALTASQSAIAKTESTLSTRFEAVNEFRSSLDDYVRTLVPRKEYEELHRRLEQQLDDITSNTNEHVRLLELAGLTYLTTKAFDRYIERQDEIRREDRRARVTIGVGVALALFGATVSLVLTLVR